MHGEFERICEKIEDDLAYSFRIRVNLIRN